MPVSTRYWGLLNYLPCNSTTRCTNTTCQGQAFLEVRCQDRWTKKRYQASAQSDTNTLCQDEVPILLGNTLEKGTRDNGGGTDDKNMAIIPCIVQWACYAVGEHDEKGLYRANQGRERGVESQLGHIVGLIDTEATNDPCKQPAN